MEAMSPWFSDKEHPGNERKRPFLKEIFKILKAYERFRNGEIGRPALTLNLVQANVVRWLNRYTCYAW